VRLARPTTASAAFVRYTFDVSRELGQQYDALLRERWEHLGVKSRGEHLRMLVAAFVAQGGKTAKRKK
jgi:hypothetical protein